MSPVQAIVVRLPALEVVRGEPSCGECREPRDSGVHDDVRECMGRLGSGCDDPRVHHAYRPLPPWRRVVLERRGWWYR